MQVVCLGICCGPGVLSLMFYVLLIIYCCRCFFYSLLSIFLFLSSSFVFFFVCLCYPALLYVIRVPHIFPPCEISWWKVWGVWYKSYTLFFMHACFIESKHMLCQVSLFVFCVLFPFQFVSMHNVSINNLQISFQLYQACTKLYLKCYLHCSHLRSALWSLSYIIKHIILLVLNVSFHCPLILYSLNYILFLLVSSVLSYYLHCSHLRSASVFSSPCLISTAALH